MFVAYCIYIVLGQILFGSSDFASCRFSICEMVTYVPQVTKKCQKIDNVRLLERELLVRWKSSQRRHRNIADATKVSL